ncbi:hypothetical protein AAur_pTC10279 (plasmid) [Paenarthrobacter aurescens TC1]|uniref:Uncharacterized protein n=1 Tax=Paenarthrobacter aurescens (strain TC1) TaxID=290340 RepID=A1RD36_PAEAT|nr:hypothetical protein AAur_pTC10279 [Paenarthrobacter aurescens TC1]
MLVPGELRGDLGDDLADRDGRGVVGELVEQLFGGVVEPRGGVGVPLVDGSIESIVGLSISGRRRAQPGRGRDGDQVREADCLVVSGYQGLSGGPAHLGGHSIRLVLGESRGSVGLPLIGGDDQTAIGLGVGLRVPPGGCRIGHVPLEQGRHVVHNQQVSTTKRRRGRPFLPSVPHARASAARVRRT